MACRITATIIFGDDPWDNPDEIISVSSVVYPDAFSKVRIWPYLCRSFGERMRKAVNQREHELR